MANKAFIKYVIYDGARGKHSRPDVSTVMSDLDGYVDKIYNMIVTKSFIPSKPRMVKIHDNSSNKERIIGVVPFYPDGIMHRLVAEVLKPTFMRGMYAHSCASIPERGNMHAIKYLKKALKDVKHTTYCVKLDIKHYYPSLDPKLIIEKLRRKVKDEPLLNIVSSIIDNGEIGITIGYYLNQWLANYFLEDLDRKICASDGVYYYVRNMDDLVILGSNKRKLHKVIDMISEELAKSELHLKENWQLFQTDSRGIDFVGYRFFHGYVLLRKRNFIKLTKQSYRLQRHISNGKRISSHEAAGFLSRAGQLKHCSGVNMRSKYVDPIRVKRLKRIIKKKGGNCL